MRPSWARLQFSEQIEMLPGGLEQLTNLEVVDDFNGPQIVFADLRGVQVFGVAADEDAIADRWIFTPVSKTEKRALLAGVASMRDALLKDGAFVVDYVRERRELQVRTVDGQTLADDLLPDADARLEPAAELAPVEPSHLRFTLDSLLGATNGVALRAVSEFLAELQRCNIAITAFIREGTTRAQGRFSAEVNALAEWSLQGAKAGSLALDITPVHAGGSEKSFAIMRDIMDAGGDSERLSALVAKAGPRALRRYEDLLFTLARHKLQLLAQGSQGAAFVSGHSASRIVNAMPAESQTEPEVNPAVGWFRGFERDDREFSFYSLTTEQVIQGAIGERVLAENKPITVHEESRYVVMLERRVIVNRVGQVVERYTLDEVMRPFGAQVRAPETAAPSAADASVNTAVPAR